MFVCEEHILNAISSPQAPLFSFETASRLSSYITSHFPNMPVRCAWTFFIVRCGRVIVCRVVVWSLAHQGKVIIVLAKSEWFLRPRYFVKKKNSRVNDSNVKKYISKILCLLDSNVSQNTSLVRLSEYLSSC